MGSDPTRQKNARELQRSRLFLIPTPALPWCGQCLAKSTARAEPWAPRTAEAPGSVLVRGDTSRSGNGGLESRSWWGLSSKSSLTRCWCHSGGRFALGLDTWTDARVLLRAPRTHGRAHRPGTFWLARWSSSLPRPKRCSSPLPCALPNQRQPGISEGPGPESALRQVPDTAMPLSPSNHQLFSR